MSLADWDLTAVVLISVWAAILGLFINFFVLGRPDSAVGLWVAVLGGFGLVYAWHVWWTDSATPEQVDASEWE